MAAVPVAEGWSPRLRLALLRAFELRREGRCVDLPMSTQRLVAFLAVRNCPVHRLNAAGTLWLDTCEERAGANLRTAVWRLRRADSELVETTATHIRLGPSVAVDVHDALAQAKRLLDKSDDCELIGPSWSGLGADLLPDWYDDWVLLEQERFRQIRLHALEALCERLTEARRFAAAIEAGLAAVAGEPLRESAQQLLMRAYLAEGNVGEAIRQYRSYRRALRETLGLEPSPLVEELIEALPKAANALAHA